MVGTREQNRDDDERGESGLASGISVTKSFRRICY